MKPTPSWLDVHPEVAAALRQGRPVVALESSLIAQGLPWPHNLKAARLAEGAIRGQGVVPATIAVLNGRPTVGLSDYTLEELAQPGRPVVKVSRRDLAAAITQSRTAATTVASTMHLAWCAGIRIFATGGIGGVHPDSVAPWDVSADLQELARTPVCVVCAGAKSILDIPRTLEVLETLQVPVVGYDTDEFPAFYLRSCGIPVPARVNTAAEAASLAAIHWAIGGTGVLLAQPLPREVAMTPEELERALETAERRAAAEHVRGAKLTPYLLGQLAELTNGKTLRANIALVVSNARLAARMAVELAAM